MRERERERDTEREREDEREREREREIESTVKRVMEFNKILRNWKERRE